MYAQHVARQLAVAKHKWYAKSVKTYVIYKDASDHARAVIDYLRDFERQTGKKLNIIDPESAEGASLCRAYDIVEYPTVVATDNNGIMQQMWRGLPLPTVSEISYYVE